MELAPSLINQRTQVCIVLLGLSPEVDRNRAWTPAAEEFLRRIHKLGLEICIIGPRPARKFGSRKTIQFMDRHDVVGLKLLASSKSHRLEFRVLNRKSKAWIRLRAETCITVGPDGVWPTPFDGWTHPGTITLDSLARWVKAEDWLPGREFGFIGSSNAVLRWASLLLDRGAKSCYVIESSEQLRCWRAYRDRFVTKGGRVLLQHEVLRAELGGQGIKEVYLKNDQGTMILPIDTVVLSSQNDHALNSPEYWKHGLYYLHRRYSVWDDFTDEDQWFEDLDWKELYWRVAKQFEAVDHSEAEGALKNLKNYRRKMLEYRKPGREGFGRELQYSGKILGRDSLLALQSSKSVPRTLDSKKALASLECFENIPCRACADACPESAIKITKIFDQPELIPDKCTGCGACVTACPAGAAVMLKESADQQKISYFLPDDSKEIWKPGQLVQLLNRRGQLLGTGRLAGPAVSYEKGIHRIVEVQAPSMHLWEARAFRVQHEELFNSAPTQLKRGWVTLNNVKRLCPVDVSVSVALWQLGLRRFEDALFCSDGSCKLCEVKVNGNSALACCHTVQEGDEILFETKVAQQAAETPLACPCKGITKKDYDESKKEGEPLWAFREKTGFGYGCCHGRWCLNSKLDSEKQRPDFQGYLSSPWCDVWASDVIDLSALDKDDGSDLSEA